MHVDLQEQWSKLTDTLPISFIKRRLSLQLVLVLAIGRDMALAFPMAHHLGYLSLVTFEG